MRREPVAPSIAISSRGRSPAARMPARIASSMSWLMYATRSTMRTILPSSVSGSSGAGVLEDPVAHLPREVQAAAVALEPLDDAERVLVVAEPARRRARAASSSSACSPAWPNGGWPRSWPRPIASTRSSFSRSARATPRAIPVRLERVRQPRAEVVALGVDEDLRLAPSGGGTPSSGRSGRGRAGTASAGGTPPRRGCARASRTSAPRAATASAPRAPARDASKASATRPASSGIAPG